MVQSKERALKRLIVASLMIAVSASGAEDPPYKLFGDDVAYYSEASLCNESKDLIELEKCLDIYRADLAEGCIIESKQDWCEHFKYLTKSKGFRDLKSTISLWEMLGEQH